MVPAAAALAGLVMGSPPDICRCYRTLVLR
jgi:hypothetical protein